MIIILYLKQRTLGSGLNNALGINVKKCLYELDIVPTALKGAEHAMRNAARIKVNVLEMKCEFEKFGWSVTNGYSYE